MDKREKREKNIIKKSHEMLESNSSIMLVGVLDPSQRNTTTQMAFLECDYAFCDLYNNILDEMAELRKCYSESGGYLARPSTFGEKQKEDVLKRIDSIGVRVYQLLGGSPNPFTNWFDTMLRKYKDNSDTSLDSENVSIITNDFCIPWYWMKKIHNGFFLNEICPLGMLQLDDPEEIIYGVPRRSLLKAKLQNVVPDKTEDVLEETLYALLINGDPKFSLADEELKSIEDIIREPIENKKGLTFEIELADSSDKIFRISKKYKDHDIVNRFKIVHFSGHYSDDELFADDERIPLSSICDHIQDSILILDGCNSSEGLGAVADLKGLTSRLINVSKALGSVVTLLPIKQDPIAAKILWGEFYRELKNNDSYIGHALLHARMALKEFYMSIGSKNPAWLLYQLIGRPCIKLNE